MPPPIQIIEPDWPAPDGVVAFSTTRLGGSSDAEYSALNLGDHVGDETAKVARNRAEFARHLPAETEVQWLSQNHGTHVIEAGKGGQQPIADGAWTRRAGVACTVMTADCLPVLFCSRDGAVVAAAHAGWRGLCAGILERCIAAMGVAPGSLLAWMGPAIGPTAFEVGTEVRQQFLERDQTADRAGVLRCFRSVSNSPDHFLADLYSLAALRMRSVGVLDVYGGQYCTYGDPQKFFSFRRDGQTGRMAATIAIKP